MYQQQTDLDDGLRNWQKQVLQCFDEHCSGSVRSCAIRPHELGSTSVSQFPPGVTIPPCFLRFMAIFHTFFSPFSLSQPVSGTVQGVVCCTVAPRPPRWVRDGHRDGEEREHLKKFQSPWRIKLPFQSFKGKGLSDLPRRDFLSIAAVKPHREADKQGSAVYRLGN